MAGTFAEQTFVHAAYQSFRPTYPPSLYSTILRYHQGPRSLAVDLGCGPGIATRPLSRSFDKVVGVDPSVGMIKTANASLNGELNSNVVFHASSAEDLTSVPGFEKGGALEGKVDMLTAGQAAHWFDYQRFFPEAARLLRKGGTLALWGYKDHVLPKWPRASDVIQRYQYENDKLGSYWSYPGRGIVQNLLRDIVVPNDLFYEEKRILYDPGAYNDETGRLEGEFGERLMVKEWTIADMKRYMRTGSAYHGWRTAHPEVSPREDGGDGDLIDHMVDEAAQREGWQGYNDGMVVEATWGSAIVLARRN